MKGMADQMRDEVDKKVLASILASPRIRALSLSCPRCGARPGMRCSKISKARKARPAIRTDKVCELRVTKAEWVIGNERSNE